MQQSMRSQAIDGTGAWFICFNWLWSKNMSTGSSSIFQHLSSILQHVSSSLSMRVKDLDALWSSGISGISVHLGVVLMFEAHHVLSVCSLLVVNNDSLFVLCLFRCCSFYQIEVAEVLIWRLQATPAATPAGSFGGVACLQARNTRCNNVLCLIPACGCLPKESGIGTQDSILLFDTMTHNVSDEKPIGREVIIGNSKYKYIYVNIWFLGSWHLENYPHTWRDIISDMDCCWVAFEQISALTCCSLLWRHNHHRAVRCSNQCDHRLLMGLVRDSFVSTGYGPKICLQGLPASSNICPAFCSTFRHL